MVRAGKLICFSLYTWFLPFVWQMWICEKFIGLLCFRLHSWHTLQSVLFPHQWGSATIFLLPQHIPDCYIPCAKCLPPAKPICTGRPWVHCEALDTVLGHYICRSHLGSYLGVESCCSCLSSSPQQGTFYTQHLYAAPPHVIHHTTVVQPNGMPATMYPAPIPPPRGNGVTMGMVAGTTMAMSAGESTLDFLFYGVMRAGKGELTNTLTPGLNISCLELCGRIYFGKDSILYIFFLPPFSFQLRQNRSGG